MTYIIAYVKTQKNKIHNPYLGLWRNLIGLTTKEARAWVQTSQERR